LTDTPRPAWTIAIGAKTHWLLAPNKVPTGETEPIEERFPDPQRIPLKDFDLDDVYGGLIRAPSGRATMTVRGTGSQQVDVSLGPNWRSVVIWAPNPGPNAPVSGAGGRGGALRRRQLRADGRHHRRDGSRSGLVGAWSIRRGVWQSFWIKPGGLRIGPETPREI
jgi:hypothetical protein